MPEKKTAAEKRQELLEMIGRQPTEIRELLLEILEKLEAK